VSDQSKQDDVEVDIPSVAEGIFFRQGLQALNEGEYASALESFKRIAHSQHYSPQFYLGVAALHLEDPGLEKGLLHMMKGLEMMLARSNGELRRTDPSLLVVFAQEIQQAVSEDRLAWKNEDFEIEGSFEELETLVQETKIQLEKGRVDHGLITELCCTVFEIMKEQGGSK